MSGTTPELPVAAVSEDTQPFLLDEKFWPIRQDLVELVKEKSFAHTGKIIGKDEELCRAVCKDLIAGLSGRKISRHYRISRHTVLSIEKIMRERGELEPLKKQVLGQLDDIIYLGLERVKDALLADEISPGQLPIPLAALIDKKGQLEAGMVPGTERSVREVTEAEIVDEFARMKRVFDVPSEVTPLKPAQDTTQDTTGTGGEGVARAPASGGGVGSGPEISQG
jgi:hypothetical protein